MKPPTPQTGEDSSCSSAQALAQVLAYHERSKHTLGRYAAGPDTLDWEAQPNPFREFSGSPHIRLPLAADQLSASFGALHVPNSISPQPFTLESIAALLELAFGLSAWKEYGPDRWAVRCNPSSGNLHPTEAYIVCRQITGVGDGVYHYLSRDHLLEQRCNVTAAMPESPSRLLIGLSSVIWREAWKYGERAFRYCQLDTGHAIGALRYAAATLGWHVRIAESFSQQQQAQWLGLDRDADFIGAEREEAELLLEISTGQATDTTALADIFAPAQTHWYGQANILDAHPMYRWPVIDEVTQASRKVQTLPGTDRTTENLPVLKRKSESSGHDRNTTFPNPLPQSEKLLAAHTGEGVNESLRGDKSILAATLIRQRRSAQRFDAKLTQDAASFYHMLDALLPRPTAPWDVWHEAAHVHPVLFVHRVAGLEPGIYALPRNHAAQLQMQTAMRRDFLWTKPVGCPEHLPLFLLAETSLSKATKIMNCHQAIAGDSTFMLAMLAEFDAPLQIAPWHYRQLYWEAGLLGQVLYLQAEAAGLRGTGIGCFFDDMCHELLGLHDKTFQSIYHFTVGFPLLDVRIASLPPYPSISSHP
ncbi:MAG: SagB/ThcOx family dehydrogenase [Gallionellaceae bacterium]